MRQLNLKLNPKNYVFRGSSGKLLGYIESRRGINIDHKKVKDIMDMPPLRNIRQIRILQGKLQVVKRFMDQLVGKIDPFSYFLKKGNQFIWIKECQKAFEDIKSYLLNNTILYQIDHNKHICLYISAIAYGIRIVLMQLDSENRERVVYYLSKTLHNA